MCSISYVLLIWHSNQRPRSNTCLIITILWHITSIWMDWFKFGTIVDFGVTMTGKVLYRWYDLAVKNTLKRCNKWLPYIFCACSENKKSSYKILTLWEKPRLCRDCKLSRFKITGRSCQDKVKKKVHSFQKVTLLVWYKLLLKYAIHLYFNKFETVNNSSDLRWKFRGPEGPEALTWSP